MNKAELIEAVAKASGESKAAVDRVLDALAGTVGKTLKKGDSIAWFGFGSFAVRKRAARQGRNPRTGATIRIKASKSVAFRAAKALKDSI